MERLLIPTFEFPPYAGGVGTFCVELAKSLAARGIAVTILAPDYGKAHHPEDAGYPFKVERFPASGYSARVLPTLVRALLSRRARFDRWLIADWPFIIAAGIARSFAKLPPFRIFLHGTDALILAQGKVPKLLRTTNVFAHAEAVVANSEYTLSIARANHPSLASTPTRVALLGVNRYWFDAAGDTAGVRARLGIPEGRRLLLSVSRVDERKGHRLMIAAVAALPDEVRRQVVYVIAGRPGDAGYQARLEAMAAGTDATILFTGGLAQDDIRALYASADLFLLVGENRTDKIEGFGLVYLEAAGQSVPSIASPVGGVPEVVLDESTGLLVDDRDPAPTTAAIARLLGDEATRQRFGTAARERACTLSWQRCADVTMGIDPATPLPAA